MNTLTKDKRILAIIGNVGTPTAVAAIPIAIKNKTLFYGAFTGAGILRKDPPDRYIINYRASYSEETAAMVDALILHKKLTINEIAFFTQRDAYGDAGFIGGISALKKHGLVDENNISHGRYERNTVSVENGLADILQNEPLPKAVIMVGAYKPCAAFIRLAKDFGLHATFLNVSFVGSLSLAKSLDGYGDGVIITQVVPHYNSQLPIVQHYRKSLTHNKSDITPSFGSLEGYIATKILIKALNNIIGVPDRENIVDALEGLGKINLGLNESLHLSKTKHQASHRVWPTIIRNQKIEPFQWQNLKD